ncbi:MAG: peptidylprolyl isomerase [Acidobacteria bacterium]|nr:peptidylprolyl isomerase [Acidobacteriota bacterium]
MTRSTLALLVLLAATTIIPAADKPAAVELDATLRMTQDNYESGQPIPGELTIHNAGTDWVKLDEIENLGRDLRLVDDKGKETRPDAQPYAPARATAIGPGGFVGFAFEAQRMFGRLEKPGTYKLVLRRDGVRAVERAVRVIERYDPALNYRLELDTPQGPVSIELHPAEAPETVHHIVNLARLGFYDGAAIPRIEPTKGVAIRGPVTANHRIVPFEKNERQLLAGTVIVEPQSGELQANLPNLIILLGPRPEWQGRATAVGRVVGDEQALSKLLQLPTSGEKGLPAFQPIAPVAVKTARIVETKR